MSAEQSNYSQEDRNEPKTLTKKPPNAYLIFQKAVGHDVRSHLRPNVTGWMKVVGEKWRGLPETERAPFREEAARLLELHEAHCVGKKPNHKSKKRNRKATKSSTDYSSSKAATKLGLEFQNAVRSQGTEVHGKQNPGEKASTYREFKWERVQVGRLHSPITRPRELPPPVPIQMYHVFPANESSPAAFGSPRSPPFRHLISESPSPSPVAFSERSTSIWSTPSSTFLPTPSSSIFETSLPQVLAPWTPQESNHCSCSALDIDLGFTHEELLTNSQGISQYSSECPPNLDVRDMADDSSSFISPTMSPFWTGPMLSLSSADTTFVESSLDPDAGSRLSTQTSMSLEELLRGDGSSLDCSTDIDGLGLNFEPSVGIAELIGTDFFL